MTKPRRLDAELVRRGLAGSRADARRAIEEGRVTVAGLPAARPARLVTPQTSIVLDRPEPRFASRGGDKLDRALDRLEVEVGGRRWLDAGASTGGFTDRLLRGGARAVAAVDVGYGQLDWALRNDSRVVVLERVNARTLEPADLPWRADAAVADLSFISLTLVLPSLARCTGDDADFVLLVKPQFEAGKVAVGRGGVVRDPAVWRQAIGKVILAGETVGLSGVRCVVSELPGPAGNREFFVHLRRGTPASSDLGASIERAIAEAGT